MRFTSYLLVVSDLLRPSGGVCQLPFGRMRFYFAVGRPSEVLGHRNVHVQNQTQSRKDLHLNRLNAYETLVIFQEFNHIELMRMQSFEFHVLVSRKYQLSFINLRE